MSSALAIAGVSAVLCDLLNDGLINHDATNALGAPIKVSVGPPDRVILGNSGKEPTQLNLFMYQVTPNTGWRNEGLPSRDASGTQRLTNAPLALNLHYLISAHASEDFHSEILLGFAMQFLHETPVLDRKAIYKALNPSPSVGAALSAALQKLDTSGLENQIEQIKITPEYLNTEEMSKLWTATQSHLRPAAAYMASVVLIEAKEPIRKSMPVLRRGDEDQGVDIQLGSWPALQSVSIGLPDEVDRKPEPTSWPSAKLGLRVTLYGEKLGGEKVTLRFEHPLMGRKDILIPQSDRTAQTISYNLPAAPTTDWVAGIYTVTVLIENGGAVRRSNSLPLPLAPTIIGMPNNIASNGALAIQCNPELPIAATKVGGVWKLTLKQEVVLRLAGMEFEPEPIPDSSVTPPPKAKDKITFVLTNAPAVTDIARLRVDGVDSLPFVRRDIPKPPRLVFDDNQKVTIT